MPGLLLAGRWEVQKSSVPCYVNAYPPGTVICSSGGRRGLATLPGAMRTLQTLTKAQALCRALGFVICAANKGGKFLLPELRLRILTCMSLPAFLGISLLEPETKSSQMLCLAPVSLTCRPVPGRGHTTVAHPPTRTAQERTQGERESQLCVCAYCSTLNLSESQFPYL